MEEDAQPLEVPIIAPIKAKKIETLEREPLKTRFTNEFMATLMANPELVRNVAVLGHLHHGKTTVMDMLVEQVRANLLAASLCACACVCRACVRLCGCGCGCGRAHAAVLSLCNVPAIDHLPQDRNRKLCLPSRCAWLNAPVPLSYYTCALALLHLHADT